MNKLGWMTGLASVLVLLTACDRDRIASNIPAIEPEAAAVTPAASTQPTNQDATAVPGKSLPVAVAPAAASEAPTAPTAPTNTGVQPLPVPNLAPPTSGDQRVPQVAVRQSDPFAATATTPVQLPAVSIAPTREPAAPPPAVRPPVPTTPVAPPAQSAQAPTPRTTPQPAPVAAAPQSPSPATPAQAAPAQVAPTSPQPVVNVPVAPAAPAASPTALAEAIAVSGVVQVGERVSVIVQVPTERTSRYVTVGERIANGNVLVKRIEMAADVEPVIVLEQNGIEIVKVVGV